MEGNRPGPTFTLGCFCCTAPLVAGLTRGKKKCWHEQPSAAVLDVNFLQLPFILRSIMKWITFNGQHNVDHVKAKLPKNVTQTSQLPSLRSTALTCPYLTYLLIRTSLKCTYDKGSEWFTNMATGTSHACHLLP